MSKQPTRLGRGLEALLGNRSQPAKPGSPPAQPATPPAEASVPAASPAAKPAGQVAPLPSGVIPSGPAVSPFSVGRPTGDAVRQISIDAISPNARQPRTRFDEAGLGDLAASIRANGVLQPVLLRPTTAEAFELVAGERRWRAARMAGLKTIPAIVRTLSDRESLEIALVENLQREDLTPLERADAYRNYIDTFRATPDTLAARLGESRTSVVNYVRLLRLPDEIRAMLSDGLINMGHARALLSINDPQRQLAIARLCVRRSLTVRQVEDLAKSAETGGDESTETRTTAASPQARHVADVELSLSKSLGLPVRLRPGKAKNSGTVVIRYNSLEEFDRIAERIGGKPSVE